MYTRQTKNVKQNVNQDTETTGTKIHAQEGDNRKPKKRRKQETRYTKSSKDGIRKRGKRIQLIWKIKYQTNTI